MLENDVVFNKKIEKDYNYLKSLIESEVNMGFATLLTDWILYMKKKYLLEWKENSYSYKFELLQDVLKLIWKLLKEKKIMTEFYQLKEKFKEKNWVVIPKWYFDPCKIENKEELEKKINDWRNWIIETYKKLEKKYWRASAEMLFDTILIDKSSCYEWEIRID